MKLFKSNILSVCICLAILTGCTNDANKQNTLQSSETEEQNENRITDSSDNYEDDNDISDDSSSNEQNKDKQQNIDLMSVLLGDYFYDINGQEYYVIVFNEDKTYSAYIWDDKGYPILDNLCYESTFSVDNENWTVTLGDSTVLYYIPELGGFRTELQYIPGNDEDGPLSREAGYEAYVLFPYEPGDSFSLNEDFYEEKAKYCKVDPAFDIRINKDYDTWTDDMIYDAYSSGEAHVVDYVNSGEWQYKLYDINMIGIVDYYGSDTSITLPTEIDGYRVFEFAGMTSISHESGDNQTITKIIVPEGYIVFDNSYIHLQALKEVVLPNSLKEIGDMAFYGCHNLESVEIPDGVEKIGMDAFNQCRMIADITIPSKISEIEDGTFIGCVSLKEIEIPSNVLYIGNEAFRYCYSLEKVVIDDGCGYIGEKAFQCGHIMDITVPASVYYIANDAIGYYYDTNDNYTEKCVLTMHVQPGTVASEYADQLGLSY